MVAGPPADPPAFPAGLSALVAGRPARAVWENELGGLTYEVGAGADRCFLKWAPAGTAVDYTREAVRLAWAVAFTPVPEVISTGADTSGSWLATRALPGESAVSDRWKTDPRAAVTAIGRGLRALHDALPVATCPFSWSAQDRLADIRARAAADRIDPARWDPLHRGLGLERALRMVAEIPPVDRLVVCQGDACAPNTLINEDGTWAGHVDLGALGVADRWADLAIATWSTEWNYGPGWADPLLAAYGVEPDAQRTAYYRLLWDLGP